MTEPSSGLSRRPFTIEEDAKLIKVISSVDPARGWDEVALRMDGRSPRQCRERWIGYLSPAIRTEPWTEAEDRLLLSEMSRLGHKWTIIAQHFNGRSGSDVKNRWYSHLKDISLLGPDGTYQVCCERRGGALGHKRRKKKTGASHETSADPEEAMARSLRALFQIPSPSVLLDSFMDLPPLLPRPGRSQRS
jgi:hypothetical protein